MGGSEPLGLDANGGERAQVKSISIAIRSDKTRHYLAWTWVPVGVLWLNNEASAGIYLDPIVDGTVQYSHALDPVAAFRE